MPRTASESVADAIRARIATGALAPGDMLPPESALLDEFGVARPTMREALRILESDGLLTVRRGVNGGALVTEPDLTTLALRTGLHLQVSGIPLADLMAALRLIQPGAVAMAATAATPDDVRGLREQVERIADTDASETFADEATEFLDALMQASGNQTLAFVSRLLNRLLHVEARALAVQGPRPGPEVEDEFRAWCVEQYTELVDLIEQGAADEAEALWQRHLDIISPALDDAPMSVYLPAVSRARGGGSSPAGSPPRARAGSGGARRRPRPG